MDADTTEGIPNIGSLTIVEQNYDLATEETLTRLEELMNSVLDGVKIDGLQTAISSLQDTLASGNHTGEHRAMIQSSLVKALLTRYGLFEWIEDLDACFNLLEDIESIDHELRPESDGEIAEVQVADGLVRECRNCLNTILFDTLISSVQQTAQSHPVNGLTSSTRNAKLLIVLGRTLVIKYFIHGDLADLNQASIMFQEAERTCASHVGLAYISLTSLSFIEWLQFVECGKGESSIRLRDYLARAMKVDEKGSSLYDMAVQLLEIATSTVQLQQAVVLLQSSLHYRMAPHPRRLLLLQQVAQILFTRFEQFGDSADLAACIALRREALDVQPIHHPVQYSLLFSLSYALFTRFSQMGAIEDLEECITLRRRPLGLQPPHPDRALLLNNLALAIWTRFNQSGVFQDLQECIVLYKEADNLRVGSQTDRPSYLSNLSTALLTRFSQKGDFQDLEESITLQRQAVNLGPTADPNRPSFLNNLASALSTRFKQSGDIRDLDESIMLHREAVDLRPAPHPDRSSFLNNLASALLTRFYQTGTQQDLEESIDLHRKALDLQPPPHSNRSMSLSSLASALRARFNQKGVSRDLDECILLHREALKLRPSPHPERPMSLGNLAATLWTRFNQDGNLQDLEECIDLQREAITLRSASHPDRSSAVSNLATSLVTRFNQKGTLEDLEEGIESLQKEVNLQSPFHPSHPLLLNSLASALFSHFLHKGVFQDLDKSILLRREALDLLRPLHPYRPTLLNNLAVDLRIRFDQKGSLQDLKECIQLHQQALNLLDSSHVDHSNALINLGSALMDLFSREKDVQDLEECIRLNKEALNFQSPTDPFRTIALENLASALHSRFNHKGKYEDLEECLSLHNKALDLRPVPHPDRSHSLNDLASALSSRFEYNRAQQHCDPSSPSPPHFTNVANTASTWIDYESIDADIKSALQYYEEASRYPTGSLINRLKYSKNWAACAQKYYPPSTFVAFSYSMELLPLIASLDLTLQQRQDVLQHSGDHVRNAAKCAIDGKQFEMAVTFLSTGRSIFWSQALQLRTRVSNELIVTHHALVEKFDTISRQLESASYSRQDLPTTKPPTTDKLTNLRNLADERQQIIEEIRRIPGSEGFLRPHSFLSLQHAAKNGPFVLLNASELGCDALVMHQAGQIEHIFLSGIRMKELQELKLLFHSLFEAGTRSINIAQNTAEVLRTLLGRDMLHRDNDLYDSSENIFRFILECLWVKVVQPVVKLLGMKKTDFPERIWWCPTGPFASLPIHAAGIYSDYNDPIDCLFEYAVSSYCTSPQDLLHPPPSMTEAFKMTTVIEPGAPGAAVLPATLEELKQIEKHVYDHQHLITHVGSDDTPNQVTDLMSDIERSSIVHFGCHGMQNLDNPLESYLLLSGGKLTMSTIMEECEVQEGALAYLSACETAKGDEVRPDESLNLVATMLFAGFRSVIGTMWSIFDEDAPIVAEVFYGYLFRNGKATLPDVRDAAHGLYLATKELRDRGRPFYNWVPYVHYGI